jgi:hypothetical protein
MAAVVRQARGHEQGQDNYQQIPVWNNGRRRWQRGIQAADRQQGHGDWPAWFHLKGGAVFALTFLEDEG